MKFFRTILFLFFKSVGFRDFQKGFFSLEQSRKRTRRRLSYGEAAAHKDGPGVQAMKKGRTLVRGTLLLTASGLALRGIGVLFQSILTRRIGAEGMGLLQLVLTVGGFAGTLASSGVRVAALQLSASAYGRGSPSALTGAVGGCLRYGLLVSAAVGTALILLSGRISEALLLDGRTAPALRVLGVLLPLQTLCGVLRGSFTACGRLRELVSAEFLDHLLSVCVTLFLLRLVRSLAAVCAAVIAGSACGACVCFFLLYTRFRRDVGRPGHAPRGSVLRLCIPLAANDYLRAGLGAVEQFLIPYGLSRSGSRHSALAAYGTISGMVFPVLWFPAELVFALSELMVSELARCQATGAWDRLHALARKSLRAVLLLTGAVFLGLYCFGGKLGAALFHGEAAGYYLRLFSPLVLFLYPDAIVDGLQKGLGQQLYLVRYNSFTNVIDVAGLFFLLPRLGIGGYLLTYAVSHLVNLFLSLRRLLTVLDGGAAGHAPVPGGEKGSLPHCTIIRET